MTIASSIAQSIAKSIASSVAVSSGGGGSGSDPIPLDSINVNGWSATYSTPPTEYDPVGDPIDFSVARNGYNAAGSSVTVNDTLTVMKRVRDPYPDQADLTADQVAISDFIYADEVVGSLTNNSTRAYPLPQCLWLNHDLDVARSSTYTVRLSVSHAHARGGRPVAAVKFIATDGTTTVEQTVSSMEYVSYSASGIGGPCFRADLDFSTLTQGASVTIDCVVYPWVGDAYQASVNGQTYPSINSSTLRVLNDRTGAYGTVYAYVDGVGGSAAVSTNPATAATTPYSTVALAAAAIKTYNNSNYSRNNTSGGIIRLVEGTYTHASFAASTSGSFPLIIEAADDTKRATTVYQDSGTTSSGGAPTHVKWRNITFKRTVSTDVVCLDCATASSSVTNAAIFENCAWDANGQTLQASWIWRLGRVWLINCTGDLGQSRSVAARKEIISLGCNNGCLHQGVHHAFGCKDTNARINDVAAQSPRTAAIGQVVHFCHLTQGTDSTKALETTQATGVEGKGYVGCVFEQYGGTTGPAVSIAADANVQVQQNVNFHLNTVVGSRTNYLYQDTGSTTIAKSGSERFSVHYQRNTKTDVFGTNANLIGNWPVVYQVNARANASLTGSGQTDSYGAGNWLGEVGALGNAHGNDATPLDPDWVDDRSFVGAGGGSGDYRPGASTELPLIPAGLAPYAFDMLGNAIANDGSAFIGALQA